MGMYDEILINIKCPKCGKKREWRVQTKGFDCTLGEYYVGDKVNNDDFPTTICIGNCPNCYKKEWILVFIEDNVITDKYELVNSPFKRS